MNGARKVLVPGLAAIALASATSGAWAQKEPIRIGVPTALTGTYSQLGEEAKQAVEFAVNEANVAGGVDGRKRVIIEGVTPEIDDGRFPIKRTVGETVVVEADVFTDGHDSLSCVLQYRKAGDDAWQEIPMRFLVNDRWRGEFPVLELGRYEYTVMAWVDAFKSWRHDLGRWVQAEDIALSLRVGAELAKKASQRATGADARWLAQRASELAGPQDLQYRRQLGLDEEFAQLMQRNADRALARIRRMVQPDHRAAATHR